MSTNRRILVVDDNRAIHDDFRKILSPAPTSSAELASLESALFGNSEKSRTPEQYDITSAYQGEESLEIVQKAESEARPFAMAFVDVRMPPGWDGVETIGHLWKASPELQVVICTAYSDYSWDQITDRIGKSDRLLILRKPFDPVEVQQLAYNLTEKWSKIHVD